MKIWFCFLVGRQVWEVISDCDLRGAGMWGGQEYSFGGLVAVEGRGAAEILIRKVHGFVGWRGEEKGREEFE